MQPVVEGQIFSPQEAKSRFAALEFMHRAPWKGRVLNLYAVVEDGSEYFFIEGPFGRGGVTALVCSRIRLLASPSSSVLTGAQGFSSLTALMADKNANDFCEKALVVLRRKASALPALQGLKWRDFSAGFYTLAFGLIFLNFAHVNAHRFGGALAIGMACWLGYRVAALRQR